MIRFFFCLLLRMDLKIIFVLCQTTLENTASHVTDTLNNVKAQADVLATTIGKKWPSKSSSLDHPEEFQPFDSADVGLSEDQVIQSTFASTSTHLGQFLQSVKESKNHVYL